MEFATSNNITSDLLNIVRGSNISESETISKRQLEEWLHQYRARLLKQDLDKGKKPNPDYIQEIDHLKLELIDAVGTNVLPTGLTSGNYISRTELEIPNTLDLNFTSGFMYIGTTDGYEIQFVPEGRAMWQQYKKYTNNDRLAFLRNNHLYIIHDKPLQFISVRGVFEIPSEVGRFINPYTTQPYYNEDSRYPIPSNMVPVIKEMILKNELGIEYKTFSDLTNNSNNKQSQNLEQ